MFVKKTHICWYNVLLLCVFARYFDQYYHVGSFVWLLYFYGYLNRLIFLTRQLRDKRVNKKKLVNAQHLGRTAEPRGVYSFIACKYICQLLFHTVPSGIYSGTIIGLRHVVLILLKSCWYQLILFCAFFVDISSIYLIPFFSPPKKMCVYALWFFFRFNCIKWLVPDDTIH